MSEAFGELNNGNGESYEIRQDNLFLYTHLGKYAIYDHVFLQTQENAGYYFWRDSKEFPVMRQCVEDNSCVQHLNLPKVSDMDYEMYVAHNTRDLGDTFPEDWV